MLGLLFYAIGSFGLGTYMPAAGVVGMSNFGLRMVAGYALLTILLVALHVILRVDLAISVYLVAALSLIGIWRGIGQGGSDARIVLHPGVLLIALGAACIVANGEIGYIPTTNDEFTTWLGGSRLIHFHGSFHAAQAELNHSGYTPGWRMLLAAPWQFAGEVSPGLSAGVSFVAHVAVAALIFDVFGLFLTRNFSLSPNLRYLSAWAILLSFLAAEGMGRLWPLYLLIEPPQVFSFASVMLIILLAELAPERRRPLYAYAGLFAAAAYLVKSAALTLLPAFAMFIMLFAMTWRAPLAESLKRAAVWASLLLGPICIFYLVWTQLSSSEACFGVPLKTLGPSGMQMAMDRDWSELAARFVAGVGDYALHYKSIVLVAAVAGYSGAVILRKGLQAAVVSILFAIVYFGALYWFYLSCWSSYGFDTLISLPRYSRVPIQVFHTLGLVLLVMATLSVNLPGVRNAVASGLSTRPVVICLVLATALMAGWQARQVWRSVVDVTDRSIWPIDSSIYEMMSADRLIRSLRGERFPERPRIIIVSQGTHDTAIRYAKYFSIGPGNGKPDRAYAVHGALSWSPAPVNVWQVKASTAEVRALFSTADVIWPIVVDPWIVSRFLEAGMDADCAPRIPDVALIRAPPSNAGRRFKCIAKQPS